MSKDTKILRIDSDIREKSEYLYESISDHDVVISTDI